MTGIQIAAGPFEEERERGREETLNDSEARVDSATIGHQQLLPDAHFIFI